MRTRFDTAPILWSLFALFFTISVMWCIADVRPYPEMARDLILGFSIFGGLAVVYLLLALRASFKGAKKEEKPKEPNQEARERA
jgi:hypothetical protein